MMRAGVNNEVLIIVRVFSVRYAYDKIRDLLFKYFTPKLGIEQMNKVRGKMEI